MNKELSIHIQHRSNIFTKDNSMKTRLYNIHEHFLFENCRREREKIVLATKCRFGEGKGMIPGLSRKAIMFNIEESLKRLKTDYVDLYQVLRVH